MRSRCVVLGEVLIDLFSPTRGVPVQEAVALVPLLGGAPANVAVQLARLGRSVELVGAVGSDPFGDRLLAQLAAESVGTRGITRIPGRRTGLMLVEHDERGERHFTPWRTGSADFSFESEQLPTRFFDESLAVLHRGTTSLAAPASKAAAARAMTLAHAAGAFVSIDLNFAFGVFEDKNELLTGTMDLLAEVDAVKASIKEAEILFGSLEPAELARAFHERGVGLVALTFGERGARLSSAGGAAAFAVSPSVSVLDTTGAGDAFFGTLLSELTRRGVGRDDLAALPAAELQDLGSVATWAGAQSVTALGATTAMVRSDRPSLVPEHSRGDS